MGTRLRVALLHDKRTSIERICVSRGVDIPLPCDSMSPASIKAALLPIENDILAVTARSEQNLALFTRARPYIRTNAPSLRSLRTLADNVLVKKKLRARKKGLCPSFVTVRDAGPKSIDVIRNEVGFPLVVRSVNEGAASVSMQVCYYAEELEKVLSAVFKKMSSVARRTKDRDERQVLIEQFLEGDVYSFDAYITPRGIIHLCPAIEIRTGRTAGFDDLFGYIQMTPPLLSAAERKRAEDAVLLAIKTLSLSSTSVHIELIRSDDEWKVVGVTPVLSGWRNDLHMLAYGIDHSMNDILVRIPKKLIFSTRVRAHAAVIRFYSRKEGRLPLLSGAKRIKELGSFNAMHVRKRPGDMCRYAKHGDMPVLDVTLSNADRTALLADIRRVEQTIIIKTS